MSALEGMSAPARMSPPHAPSLLAVAWDIDGTLIDSEPVHLLALQSVCRDHRVAIDDLPDTHFIGVHVDDVWQALAPRFAGSLTRAQWLAQLNQHYLRAASRLAPMPGAVAVVAELSRRRVLQVAVSNSHRVVVQANLAVAGLADHLLFSISLDDVTAGKPDPAPYTLAAGRLGMAPARLLAIEDSLTGLRSARHAGLRTIGYGVAAGLSGAADRTIAHLREVLDEFESPG